MLSEAPAVGELQPTFFVETAVDEAATRLAGCEMLRQTEMVRFEMVSPQRGYFSLTKRVTDEHRQRWPDAYAEFRAAIAQGAHGFDDRSAPAETETADDEAAGWKRAFLAVATQLGELAGRLDRLERTVVSVSGRVVANETGPPYSVSMLPTGGPLAPQGRPPSALDAFADLPRPRRHPHAAASPPAAPELALDAAGEAARETAARETAAGETAVGETAVGEKAPASQTLTLGAQ